MDSPNSLLNSPIHPYEIHGKGDVDLSAPQQQNDNTEHLQSQFDVSEDEKSWPSPEPTLNFGRKHGDFQPTHPPILQEHNQSPPQNLPNRVRVKLNEQLDEAEAWFKRPHTLTGLVVMLAVLLRAAQLPTPLGPNTPTPQPPDIERNIRSGLGAAASCFMFYCTLQLSDGELVRPHPVVWRAVHGATVMYLVFVVFLLAQPSAQNVNAVLHLFESRSGTNPLPRDDVNSSYASECSLSFRNIWSKIDDRFFVAHLVGWFVKALILRDWGMMWTCSILFEVLEISLQRLIPNFAECWWDRWLLDVLGCNFIGALAGMRFASWVGAREYDWSGVRPKSRPRRVAMQFVPKTFPKRHEWQAFSSWRRFGVALLVVMGVMLGELNGFFLKSALQIPTDSDLNTIRVIFMVPAVYASVVELYAFSNAKSERVGPTAWLVVSLGVLELLLAAKQFILRDAFSFAQLQPDPVVVICWVVAAFFSFTFVLGYALAVPGTMLRWMARAVCIPFILLLVVDFLRNFALFDEEWASITLDWISVFRLV